jgi:hypothetical protein
MRRAVAIFSLLAVLAGSSGPVRGYENGHDLPWPEITRTGQRFPDGVAMFKALFKSGDTWFEVGDGRHAYTKVVVYASQLEKVSREIYSAHEDLRRPHGHEFHRHLELLALNAHRLRVAVAERNRTNIFTYWRQIKLIESLLAKNQEGWPG